MNLVILTKYMHFFIVKEFEVREVE